MSSLTSKPALLTRRLATTASAATTKPSSITAAAFSTTITRRKSVVDTAKEKLKTVDRKVADKLVDGIDVGTTVASKLKGASPSSPGTVTNKIKEATHEVGAGKATGKAAELRGEMEGKASEVAGEAKGKASEVAGEVKGKAEEAKEKMV